MNGDRDKIQYLAASALTHLHSAEKDYQRYKETVLQIVKDNDGLKSALLCDDVELERTLKICAQKMQIMLEALYIHEDWRYQSNSAGS